MSSALIRHGRFEAELEPALVRVNVLGPLTVLRGGQIQLLGAQKQRCLLGLLALHHD